MADAERGAQRQAGGARREAGGWTSVAAIELAGSWLVGPEMNDKAAESTHTDARKHDHGEYAGRRTCRQGNLQLRPGDLRFLLNVANASVESAR